MMPSELRKLLVDCRDFIAADIESDGPLESDASRAARVFIPDLDRAIGSLSSTPSMTAVERGEFGDAPLADRLRMLGNWIWWRGAFGDTMRTVEEARTLALSESPRPGSQCRWSQHDDLHMPGTWDGSCGVRWSFIDGDPVGNGMRFCPYCAGRVAVSSKKES